MQLSLQTPTLAREALRVLIIWPWVEFLRHAQSPSQAVHRLRQRASRLPTRDALARQLLRRAVAWMDARLPFGPHCYRRALWEMALDRQAAAEELKLGMSGNPTASVGHAWLGHTDPGAEGREYDVLFKL